MQLFQILCKRDNTHISKNKQTLSTKQHGKTKQGVYQFLLFNEKG